MCSIEMSWLGWHLAVAPRVLLSESLSRRSFGLLDRAANPASPERPRNMAGSTKTMATLLVKSAMAHGKQRHTHGLMSQSGPPPVLSRKWMGGLGRDHCQEAGMGKWSMNNVTASFGPLVPHYD